MLPLREQVYEWLFSDARLRSIKQYTIAGRVRMCASMEGNAIFALPALSLFSRSTGHQEAREASERAAEYFLQHHLFKHLSDGTVISDDFLKLFYPYYWHYNILFGLKVLAEQATSTTYDAAKRFRYLTANVCQMEVIRLRKNTIV